MPCYWVIAPYNSEMTDIWERVWKLDLEEGIISVGWRELGDISQVSESFLKSEIQKVYPNPPQVTTNSVKMLWSFYHVIQTGDIIIARRGRKRIAGIGTVTGKAYYLPEKNITSTGAGKEYPNHINVSWQQFPRDIVFPNMVFGLQTLYEIKKELYKNLVKETIEGPIAPQEEGVEDQSEFVLEKYLEDFIVTNFESIIKGELVLYHDVEEDVNGQQYGTEVGPIDILAKEPKTNSFVVIELKKGRESDKVIGQTLRYMGWVAEN